MKIINHLGIDSPRVNKINPIKIQQKDSKDQDSDVSDGYERVMLPFKIKNLDTGEVTMEDPFSKECGVLIWWGNESVQIIWII